MSRPSNSLRIKLACLCIAAVVATATPIKAQTPMAPSVASIKSPGPSADIPELKRLVAFAGKWDAKMRRKGDERIHHVTSQVDWVLGGRFLRTTYSGDSVSGMMLTTYDTDAKVYRRWQFDRSGTMTPFTGHWDAEANTMHFEHVSDDGSYRIVVENTVNAQEQTESFRLTIKDRDGQELNEFTGSSRRSDLRSANRLKP